MIKTLRMTSIIAAALAGVFFIFPVVFGVRSDKQVEQFLNSPSVIEKFNKAEGSKSETRHNQTSPLVKQGEAFAAYLNPPPKPQPKTPARSTKRTASPKPSRVSVKFTLTGTSVCPENPEKSLAFINEPGKGLHWVRQSSEVGHLIIEQIKEDLIVVRDGQRTFELPVEQRQRQINLLASSPSVSTFTNIQNEPEYAETTPMPAETTAVMPAETISRPTETTPIPTSISRYKTRAGAVTRPPASPPIDTPINNQESEALGELVDKIKDLQGNLESDKTDSEQNPQEKAEQMDKLISEFRAARISSEEAKNLGDLGKELEDVQQNPTRSNNQIIRRRLRPRSSTRQRR